MLSALLMCIASSGCFAVTFGSTKKIEQDRTEVDVRVTRAQADVSGTACYVDKKVRVVSDVRVQSRNIEAKDFATFALIEFVIGAVVLIGERTDFDAEGQFIAADGRPWGLIPVVDGALAIGYIILRNGSVSTSERWTRTSETASCPP